MNAQDTTKKPKFVAEKDAYYGVNKYTPMEKAFHADVMELLKSQRYRSLAADSAMVVFGRCYAVYCLSQLKKEGKVKTL